MLAFHSLEDRVVKHTLRAARRRRGRSRSGCCPGRAAQPTDDGGGGRTRARGARSCGRSSEWRETRFSRKGKRDMHGRAHPTDGIRDETPCCLRSRSCCEVDRSRQVEYRRWLLDRASCVLAPRSSTAGSARCRCRTGTGWRKSTARSSDEDAIGRRLRLEIASLESPAVIEWLATNQLHLVAARTGRRHRHRACRAAAAAAVVGRRAAVGTGPWSSHAILSAGDARPGAAWR